MQYFNGHSMSSAAVTTINALPTVTGMNELSAPPPVTGALTNSSLWGLMVVQMKL